MKKNNLGPEILAPVGNMKMCEAAVHNGANAIYLGFPGFNARGRTVDHSYEELREMIDLCHRYEVKVFLALNILIFENELKTLVVELIKALALAPDAFIIQDIGLARLIHFLAPTQVIHASTQMTVTNHEHILFTEDLNLNRYVLGREVSVSEMEVIRKNTTKELEVFVHGALCVAYSGQCLTSEGFGGRSANRGQCAQSCRLEYELIVDDVKRELGSLKYLVSPKDLCGLENIPKLIEIGINSFKIEGRLKTPEYVAATTKSYHDAIQSVSELASAQNLPVTEPLRNFDVTRNLEVTYSRGFFNGWMDGVNHQKLVDGRFGSHRGSEIGKVISCSENGLVITSTSPLFPGDGLAFVEYSKTSPHLGAPLPLIGSRIFSVEALADQNTLLGPLLNPYKVFFANDFNLASVSLNATVYLNDSPSMEKSLSKSFTDKTQWKTIPLDITISGEENAALKIAVSDGEFIAQSFSTSHLTLARNPLTSLTFEKVKAKAASLSGTEFSLHDFEFHLPAGLYLQEKELRKTRQNAIRELQVLRQRKAVPLVHSETETLSWLSETRIHPRTISSKENKDYAAPPKLNLLIREFSHLDALENLPLSTVYLDFEHGRDYKAAVAKVRDLGFLAGIATTRILKPNEYHNLKVIESLHPDLVLVRNLGAWQYLKDTELKLAGDFSLNATNSLTTEYYLNKGLATLCPAYDLNQWQLFDLIDQVDGANLEVTVHQYLPSFHMEHCVFAAFMSQGTSFRDCGKPCEKHRVELRDHTGRLHPLKADQECRNTMFNGKPQSAALLVPELLARGVKNFRVEALYEPNEMLRSKVIEYAKLIQGHSTPKDVFNLMGIAEKYGVMEGQIRNQSVYKDRKKTNF